MVSALKNSHYYILLYKVQCFIGISGTDKTDNLTCEIIYDNFTCENYRFSNNHYSLRYFILLEKTVVYIINRTIHVCLEIPDLFLVLNMISHSFAALTRVISRSTLNKSGISAHPCIILYIN